MAHEQEAVNNTICCGIKMKFNDNSLTEIKSDGQLYPECTPVFYCDKCHSFYDGFTAHQPVMEKFTPRQVKRIGCKSWFKPDVLDRLNKIRNRESR